MCHIARFFMDFTQKESCGKCVPCREGTHIMLELLDDITEARAGKDTVNKSPGTGRYHKKHSSLRPRKNSTQPGNINNKRVQGRIHGPLWLTVYVPQGYVKPTKKSIINEEKCVGCGLCKKVCPVNAISGGSYKKAHVIDNNKCIKCKACLGVLQT